MIPHLTFVVANKNRTQHVAALLQDIRRLQKVERCRVVVVDCQSDDADVAEVVKAAAIPATLVTLHGVPFNRGQCLNTGVASANIRKQDIVFFADADVRLPEDFAVLAFSVITPGTAWFPICYSLHRDKPMVVKAGNGWWRDRGYGNCGFVKTDFCNIRQWNAKLCWRWGGEDTDIFKRAKRAGLRIIRKRVNGFYHSWHRNDKQWKSRYMSGKRGFVAKPTRVDIRTFPD